MNIKGLDVGEILKTIKHPALDFLLVDLGLVQNTIIEGNKVKTTFYWPDPDYPEKEQIKNSILDPIKNLGAKIEYSESLMNLDDREMYKKIEKGIFKF